MPSTFPRITISVTRDRSQSDASGDLNTLSVGFGLFQAWLYTAVFGIQATFPAEALMDGTADKVFDSFCISFSLALLLLAFTNQVLLRFYVGKKALALAAVLASTGTVAVFGTGLGGTAGTFVAYGAGLCMGVGASLMVAMWGTAFARYEFTTIILNTAIAIVLGMALYLCLINWILVPLSAGVTALLPPLTSLLLWKLTPIPYYRRQEIPIFHPLPIRRASFVARFGLPSLIFGTALGALRFCGVNGILHTHDITTQLVIGAAACAGVALILAVIALTKGESHWDMLFRCLVPFAAAALFCLPQLDGPWQLPAGFAVVVGYICFEALMWIFFSDMAQEFRLSPIFVFGLGRGLLTAGAFAGASLMQGQLAGVLGALPTATETLALMLLLITGYSLLPRQREIRAIIDPRRSEDPGWTSLKAKIDQQQEEKAAAAEAEGTGDAGASADGAGTAPADERAAKGRFHAKCEEIADRYLLSRRETEVMFLLAKGHNAAFIQDKLCISKSTAKTHINHIYRKLDIHTQQELLNLMEQGKGPEAAAKPATGPDAGRDGRDGQRRAASSIFGER